jgi:hypothetical protein
MSASLRDYLHFRQTVEGAIRVAHETLLATGTSMDLSDFKEVRVVKTEDNFLVHLIGSFEGSWIVSVPRRRRVTRYECELEEIKTHLRMTDRKLFLDKHHSQR